MEYKKILVPVDGSELSKEAFNRAVYIAKRDEAKLVLTHIIDTKYDSAIKPYLDIDQIYKSSKESTEKMINNYEQMAKKADFYNLKTLIKVGSPKEIILEKIIPEENIDLVVLGATGISAIERVLVGSVSEGVFRYANCDVLVER